MNNEEILKYLEYSKCECPIDYKPELGVVNAICPNHSKSHLIVNGLRAEYVEALLKKKKLDSKYSKIV